ncbi:hypothetical protein S2091_2570 [Solimicrobium silvestre]|uniref:Uncharacterized protein n=1 Tax=Solimicrobium silvestre TaxID=2099400 RepID=A0A2S9GYR2_9BURK|nr:hypothetical protein S2091_2570 [Solimicrobium silvestre]
MRNYFPFWLMPFQVRKNQGSMLLLSVILFSPLILIPSIWPATHNLIRSLSLGCAIPFGFLIIAYWASYIVNLRQQLSPINTHLLPKLKSRLFYATLILWLLISISAALIFGLFFNRAMQFWIAISFLMCYLTFLMNGNFIALALYGVFICFSKQIWPVFLLLSSNYTFEICAANLLFCCLLLIQLTHPSQIQAERLQKKFKTLRNWGNGDKAEKNKYELLFEKNGTSVYQFCVQNRISAKKSLFCYGLSPSAHWSRVLNIVILISVAYIFSQLLIGTNITSKNHLSEWTVIAFMSINSGVPLSFITATWQAIHKTKKEQLLMSLLPGSPSQEKCNRIYFHYVVRNNLISLITYFCTLLIVKNIFNLPFFSWDSILLFSSLPLFSMLLVDYSKFTYSTNDIMLKLILPFSIIATISFTCVSFFEIPIWQWDSGLLVISVMLLIWRWNKMMQAPPAFPAGRA